MKSVKSKIEEILEEYFSKKSDIISVVSERGDDSHFSIKIISDTFNELSLIQRSRLVHKLLNNLLETKEIHAISLNLISNNE